MSRKQWLIVAALMLGDVIFIGVLTTAVIRSMRYAPSPPTPTSIPTPTASPRSTATPSPTPTSTFSPTRIPRPTSTSIGTPTPVSVPLKNHAFEGIVDNSIPGWQTGAFVNWASGEKFNPVTSYAAPHFHEAESSRWRINGPTLQIDTARGAKLRAWVYQTVKVQPGSQVRFRVRAAAYVGERSGGYTLKVGVDPDGGEGCQAAHWGVSRIVNQTDGVVLLFSEEVVVSKASHVTVCMFAEPQFAQSYHAAFFDDAKLIALPPPPP